MTMLSRIQPENPCNDWVAPGAPKAQCMKCGFSNRRHKQKIKVRDKNGNFLRFEIPKLS